MVQNPPASGGDTRDVGSVPVSGKFSGVRDGNPLQYSGLENSMNEPGGLQSVGLQRVGQD